MKFFHLLMYPHPALSKSDPHYGEVQLSFKCGEDEDHLVPSVTACLDSRTEEQHITT